MRDGMLYIQSLQLNMLHKSPLQYILLLLILFTASAATTYIGMTVTTSSTQINLASTYNFNINRQYDPVNFAYRPSVTAVPSNTVIIITLPSQFITISDGSTLSCLNSANAQPLTCNVNTAAKTITIPDYYSTSTTLGNTVVAITINNLINAYKAGESDNFYWQIVAPNGTYLGEGPSVTNTVFKTSIIFTPGVFSACSISAGQASVSSYSPITLTLTPLDPIPSSGQLIVIIPSYWTSDPLQTSTLASSPSCTGVSNTGASVSCTYSQAASQQIIVISNLAAASTINTQFSVSISNILLPPTKGSSESISIYSQWGDGTQIDTCSSTISDIAVVAFQSATLVSKDSTIIQSDFTAKMELVLSRNFYYLDSIQITLPSDFSSPQISSTTFTSFTKTANLNVLTLDNFPSNPEIIPSNNALTFTLSSIKNPLSTAPVSLKVTLLRNSQPYQQSTLTYTATSTTVDSFTINAQSNFVQNVGIATFTITSTLKFPANSNIVISYPSSISVSSTASTSVSFASLNGAVVSTATFRVTSNQIIFSNIFSTDFTGTVMLKISTFVNPYTVQPSTYVLMVQDQNSYLVMSGSYVFSANTKSLISNSIIASSYRVLDSGVTYTAKISTNFGFNSVSIILPNDISVATGFQITCKVATINVCSLSGRNLTFTGTLSAGSYDIQWGLVTNPNSFHPTSSFQIYTYSNGFGVENSQGVLSISMISTRSFSNLILYPSSYMNSAPISINLLLDIPAGAPDGKLTITVPTEIVITSATCVGCTISPPYVYLSYFSNSSSLNIVLGNIVNVGSFKPIGKFYVALDNSAGESSLLSSIDGWTNNLPSLFTTAVSGNNNYRGQSNTFRFQLAALSNGQSQVQVLIDSSFTAIATAPLGFTKINSYTLRTSCTGTSCSINFAIVNPTADGNYTFILTSYSSDGFKVGTSTSNEWTFDCMGTTCRSCSSNSLCADCYSQSISNFYIFNTFSKNCDRGCDTGYFQVNTTCSKCDSNCSECVSTSKTCKSCISNFYLDTTYSLCVPSCQPGYFANALNMICTPCTAPCATCTGLSTHCLTCNLNFYLLNNTCPSICPDKVYVANSLTGRCDVCSTNCLTCSGAISTCLTCDNSAGLYFQNSKCVSNCSTNYFIVNSICTYCQTPCRTCTRNTITCTTCFINSTAPIYYNQYCIASNQCPNGYYINTTNSSCERCPTSCSTCSSPTVCTICSANYYLLGASCLQICPNTTYNASTSTTGVCLACNSCFTCSSSSACTSCIASQYLYQSVCYSICPNGTFSLGSICSPCLADCPTCQNSSYCTSCVTSMNLYQGVCYLTCPASTYADTVKQLCVGCPSTCTTCTSSSSCQTCGTKYSLQNGACVLVCSVGLSFNQTCYPCGLYCDICDNTKGVCSLCKQTYLLYNNTCLTKCPVNMLTSNGQSCSLCTTLFTNCSTCTNTACLSCNYGQLVNGTCVPCSPGYYAESSACTVCPSSCATCESQIDCTSCIPGRYQMGASCISSCPANMAPNGTTCSICLSNCNICNQQTSICEICSAGYYLYNNLCSKTCPDPLVVSYDFLTCVTKDVYAQQFSQAARIIPFPFTIGVVILIVIGFLLRCVYRDMHLRTAFCGLISLIEVGTWVIFLSFQYLYYVNYHYPSFYNMVCGVVGVAFLVLANFIHLKFYYKYIGPDQEFVRWSKKNNCANKSILIVSTTFNFKFYRFIHSKFLGREQTSMTLTSTSTLFPFSMLSIISIFTCSIPVFVGCALALYNSISQDQQFYIALDTITVTGIMIFLILMDLKHEDEYFNDEHEAKNLKKKVYEQDEIKFDMDMGNPMEENVSHQQLIEVQYDEGEGDMALPPSANKLQATFAQTSDKQKLLKQASSNVLPQQSKVQQNYEIGSQQHIELQSEDSVIEQKPKVKWTQKQYDHFGYLIKYDSNNNQVKYDENGYRVQIDEKGKHHFYNSQGMEMIMVDGEYVPHDKDGYRIRNGKRYNEKWHEMREENGKLVPYDKNGFRVVGQGENEKHIDENGYEVREDENGKLRRYQQDGYEVLSQNGKTVFKDQKGNYMRKNQQGEWQMYDPSDGFILKYDPQSGRYLKYNRLGLKVIKDQYGNIHYQDEFGYKVTILPGNELVRYDDQGYRIQIDANGNRHRFDQDGYEMVEDQNGHYKFIDENGYRVERDLYGAVSLYDSQNNLVVIDPVTGKHRRYNEQGLEIVTDSQGNKKLMDKRGRIVKQLQDTYEKYDQQGNKIWLDEDGYQIEQDDDGNLIKYDKIGDRVISDGSLQQFSENQRFDGVLGVNTVTKPLKYHYKPQRVDQQQQLNKLLSANQIMQFQDSQQIQSLQEVKDNQFPVDDKDIDHQFNVIMNQQRTDLLFNQDGDGENNLNQLKEFQFKEELVGNLVEPNLESLEGLMGREGNGRGGLLDKQWNQHGQLDGEMLLRNTRQNGPIIKNGNYNTEDGHLLENDLNKHGQFDQQFSMRNPNHKLPFVSQQAQYGDDTLADRNYKQNEFDKEFAMRNLDAKQPRLHNSPLAGHNSLDERDIYLQGQYDRQAYVREMDRDEPDIGDIRRRQAIRAEMARRKAANNHLNDPQRQEDIEIKSVADISVKERSFQNEGVEPMENRTDYDEINSLDGLEIPIGRKHRGNRSDVRLVNSKKQTQTVYNYNTVQVQIKKQQKIYDQQEQIQSLHEQQWQQQLTPMHFARQAKQGSDAHNTNANTHIQFIEDEEDNDALSDLIHQSQSRTNQHQPQRYKKQAVFSGQGSIEQIQEQLFQQAKHQRGMRERRQFHLSGAPNPLVQYAKNMQAQKKSLQQKMYLQHGYKR